VADLMVAGQPLRPRPVAEIIGVAAGTAAVRKVERPTEAIPEADRTAVLQVAGTVTIKNFSLVSPHTSLTVRRLRKEPPVLPKFWRAAEE
jgi:hypothetical protein